MPGPSPPGRPAASGTMPTFEPLATEQTDLALRSTIQTRFIDRRAIATEAHEASSVACLPACLPAGVAPGLPGLLSRRPLQQGELLAWPAGHPLLASRLGLMSF